MEGGAQQARHLEARPPPRDPPSLEQGHDARDRGGRRRARRLGRGTRPRGFDETRSGVWRPDYSLERGAFPAPRLSPPLRLRPRAHPHLPLSSLHAQGGPAWDAELAFVDLAMRYNRLLRGARTVRQIADKLDLDRAQILMSQLQPAILRPAYILVRDVREKQLFFVIRGTHSVRDTVTSLTAHSRPHHAIGPDGAPVLGRAHAGFLSTARWLARHVREDLAGAMRANPGYQPDHRRAQPRRGNGGHPDADSERARGRRPRAEPLRVDSVPCVRVPELPEPRAERELPRVHHLRRRRRGRRAVRQLQQGLGAPGADRRRRVGAAGPEEVARDDRGDGGALRAAEKAEARARGGAGLRCPGGRRRG